MIVIPACLFVFSISSTIACLFILVFNFTIHYLLINPSLYIILLPVSREFMWIYVVSVNRKKIQIYRFKEIRSRNMVFYIVCLKIPREYPVNKKNNWKYIVRKNQVENEKKFILGKMSLIWCPNRVIYTFLSRSWKIL